MLPVIFSESAQKAIKKLEKLELTFRVFGMMQSGHLAIEAFARDMRESEPFIDQDILIFEEENVILYIPKHHLKFIEGVTVEYYGWREDDQQLYDENRTYRHHGFECLEHESEISGLSFSRSEVDSIVSKVFWQDHHGAYYAFAMGGAAAYLDSLDEGIYSPLDIHNAIGAGYSNLD